MQAIWKGVISFGLVSIPIAVYPALRKEDLKLRMVRKKDLSPINYKRVAEVDGEEVPYEQVVKAFEYEKGEFVPLEPGDFKKAQAEGVQSVQINDFVPENDIDPIFFDKPYYLEPEKGGAHAYVLLRDALAESGVVGIGKVVIRSRQHLAAVKAKGDLLVLQLLHFAEDMVEAGGMKTPEAASAKGREMELAKTLIGSMKTKWEPAKYKDDYQAALREMIQEKLKGGKRARKRAAPPERAGNIVNMVDVLEQSLKSVGKQPKRQPSAVKHRRAA